MASMQERVQDMFKWYPTIDRFRLGAGGIVPLRVQKVTGVSSVEFGDICKSILNASARIFDLRESDLLGENEELPHEFRDRIVVLQARLGQVLGVLEIDCLVSFQDLDVSALKMVDERLQKSLLQILTLQRFLGNISCCGPGILLFCNLFYTCFPMIHVEDVLNDGLNVVMEALDNIHIQDLNLEESLTRSVRVVVGRPISDILSEKVTPSQSEIASVCWSILRLAEHIAILWEECFGEEKNVKDRISLLRGLLEQWFELETDYSVYLRGLDVNVLKKVQVRLERIRFQTEFIHLELQLMNSQARILHGLIVLRGSVPAFAKLLRKFFPMHLEGSLNVVIEALEHIQDLKLEESLTRSVRLAVSRPISDSGYVPILETKTAVINVIENFDGPPTVLLYGGPGTGKSVLARDLTGRYGREENNIFDLVTYVECSDASTSDDAVMKKYEILRDFSPSSLDLDRVTKISIANAFRALLSVKKALIILDDVSDMRFMNEIWEATKDITYVKLLVTSQLPNLFDNFERPCNVVAIRMARPDIHEARQILASLSGCDDKIIPGHLQEIADKIIEATDRNPLALSSVAGQLGSTEHDPWQNAYLNLSDLLDKGVHPVVLGETASRSLFTSIKLILDSVRPDAKLLLFLIYACKGDSVPNKVLKLLYSAMDRSLPFILSVADLTARDLMLFRHNTLGLGEDQTHGQLEQQSSACSCPSLVKLYILKACQEEVRSTFGALFAGGGSKLTDKFKPDFEIQRVRLTIALCAFYFDRTHADKIVADIATQTSRALNFNHGITDRRGKATAPIIWLLEGEESYARLMRKVFVEYAYNAQLDYESIADLLDDVYHPSGALARLSILTSITEIFEGVTAPLLNEDSPRLLNTLVVLMDPKSTSAIERSMQMPASKALLSLCQKAAKEKSTFLLAKTTDVVTVLVRSIKDYLASRSGQSHRLDLLAENAVVTLRIVAFGYLTSGERRYGIDDIRNVDGAHEAPVQNVDGAHEAPVRNVDGAHEALVRNVDGAHEAPVQNVDGGHEALVWNVDGAHEALVELLFERDQPVLQENAARVLAYWYEKIGDRREVIKSEILKRKGAVEILVGFVDLDDDETLKDSSVTQPSEIEVEREDSEVLDTALRNLCSSSKLSDANYDRRQKAFEPIRLSLLEEPNKDLKKAYFKYVSKGLLDFDNIALMLLNLAAHPVTLKTFKAQNSRGSLGTLKILTAIENVCRVQSEIPFLSTSNREILLLEALVHIMSSNDPAQQSLQAAASRVLIHFSKKVVEEKKTSLVTEDILRALVTLIQDSYRYRRSDTLAANAASALRELGYRLAYRQEETSNVELGFDT